MGKLFDDKRLKDCIINLSDVLLHELSKNIKQKLDELSEFYEAKVKDDLSYKSLCRKKHMTLDICREILKSMLKDFSMYTMRRHEPIESIANADSTINSLFKHDRKRLDIMAYVECGGSYKWILGDCKFASKPNSNLLKDDDTFDDSVHQKFQDVQKFLKEKEELFFETRYVVVTTAVYGTAYSMLRNKTQGKSSKIDYSKYCLVTLSKIEKTVKNETVRL